jgi:hypothetical protein
VLQTDTVKPELLNVLKMLQSLPPMKDFIVSEGFNTPATLRQGC